MLLSICMGPLLRVGGSNGHGYLAAGKAGN